MLILKKAVFWSLISYLFLQKPFILAAIYTVFYTNRYTRVFIKNKIYDFYGLDASEREALIQKSDEIWGDFWRRFAQNLSESKSGSSSRRNQGGISKPSDSRHRKVGFCQGWNVSSTAKSSHYLYKCGNCGHAGCDDRNCGNNSFSGNICKICNHRSNFTV